MKISKTYYILAAAVLAAAVMVCLITRPQTAHIKGTVDGAAEKQLVVKQLEINRYTVLDTVRTGKDGSFKYKAHVRKGEPEFIYLFYNDTRVAALLLEKGEKAVVKADTLGNYSVSGSEGSEKLAEIDREYVNFTNSMDAVMGDAPEMARVYLAHYRNNVRHLIANPYSLSVIPVLFERMGENSPVFNQPNDVFFFRMAADSLQTVYPKSRYVKALKQEVTRRTKLYELDGQLREAAEVAFPDINLPDINGRKKALSSLDDKAILIHFWDAGDIAHKMLNIETLIPVYERYHKKGFEVYAVCLSPDKALWGSIVKSQELPWINVNDGLGGASPAALSYNVTALPTSILIVDGDLYPETIKGADGLRKILDKVLK